MAWGAATEKFTPLGVMVLPSGQGLPLRIALTEPPAGRRTHWFQSSGNSGEAP
ncbi:hypothetical protein WH7805_12988 [Synechococcus sp. WH 7805]|nr:hypothetical protein WH7805_12988 [Synechococcus sp. WH 7805]